MLNIVTLVGVLQENPELKEFESGVKGTFITLRVVKPFKSMDGNYDMEAEPSHQLEVDSKHKQLDVLS